MKTNKMIIRIICLLLGTVGMAASGLNWHMGIGSWLTPIFLLYFSRNSKKTGILILFLASVIAGIISRTCFAAGNSSIPNHIMNGLGYAIPVTIPYLADKLLNKKGKRFYFTLVFPASVVFLEYLSASVIGTWGLMAHTLSLKNPLVQMVSLSGLFSLSFLIAWLGSVINWSIENQSNITAVRKNILIYVSIIIVVFIFGIIRSAFISPASKTVKVAAVTGNTNIFSVFEDEAEIFRRIAIAPSGIIPKRIFSTSNEVNKLIKTTIKAAREGAKIIVWNEYALILDTIQENSLLQQIKTISGENKTYVLISYLGQDPVSKPKPFSNKSILVTPLGDIAWEYLKSGLHPKAELPIINSGDFKVPYLDTEYGRLGNIICYDMDIIPLSSQTGRKRIDIMLVPAFDWEEITPLHSEMAGFEAIQNSFSIIRSNGRGLSVVYDYYGNTIAQNNTLSSDAAILYADLPVRSAHTFFAKTGNIFVYLCIFFLVLILGLRIYRK